MATYVIKHGKVEVITRKDFTASPATDHRPPDLTFLGRSKIYDVYFTPTGVEEAHLKQTQEVFIFPYNGAIKA
jgi:hypothetical protein